MGNVSAAAAAKSLQLCPTLCDLIDGSPPGSPVPGILQARTLEWVAIAFSDIKLRRCILFLSGKYVNALCPVETMATKVVDLLPCKTLTTCV